MKSTFILILFTFLACTTFAQFPFEVFGEIKKPKRNYIIFGYYDKYFLNFKTDTIRLNADNTFNINDSCNSNLILANIEVTPKQSIQVCCVANQKLKLIVRDSLTNYTFEGSLKKINDYIFDDSKNFESLYNHHKQRHPDFDKLADEHSDLYYSITDSMTLERLSFLTSYFSTSENSFEKQFIHQKKQELIYSNLIYKLTYDDPSLEKFTYYHNYFKIADNTISYMFSDKITFNDTTLLNNAAYLNFTRWFFMELVFRFKKENSIQLSKEAFYDKLYCFVNELSSNQFCNAIIKASFINDEVKSMGLDSSNVDRVYGRFVDSLQNCKCIPLYAIVVKNNFNNKLAELTPLKPGNSFPNCVLTTEQGKTFSLESLKGKLIYIDVWASWCGKCLEAMPSWNLLVERFKLNNEVAFVTISTDEESDKLKWSKLLNKFHIKGYRLISIGGQNSEFAKKFYINSYPTNILLNKDGTIISLQAPRPDKIDIAKYLYK